MGEALRKRILQDQFESPALEAMLNLIVAADHLQQRVDEVCGRYGVTSAQYNVLRILRGARPDGYSRCDIARRLLQRAPDVTRLIDRLETQQFVERVRTDSDRRLSITRISPKGMELLDAMHSDMQSIQTYVGERVSRRDCRELSRICEGIYAED